MKRKKFLFSSYVTKIFAFEVYPFLYFPITLNPAEGGRSCFSTPIVPLSSFTLSLTFHKLYVRRAAMMVPVGLIGKVWSFVSFLSFFLFLLVLGLLKGIIFYPVWGPFIWVVKLMLWWLETNQWEYFETRRYLLRSSQITCNCIFFFILPLPLTCIFFFCNWYLCGLPSLPINFNFNFSMASNTYVAFGWGFRTRISSIFRQSTRIASRFWTESSFWTLTYFIR